MIHIIGTCHKTQILTDLIKKKALGAPPFAKLQEFRAYLEEVAVSLQVVAIGEEMSADRVVAYGHNAVSIAASAAGKLNLAHIFCEPDGDDRRQLGLRAGQEMVHHANEIARQQGRDLADVHREEVRKQFTTRELFWVSRLESFYSKGSVLFICGADHAATFPMLLASQGLEARVHCTDWTETASIPCPCCI